MLSAGVVFMFFTAGLLTHCKYLIEFKAPVAVAVFWTTVVITAVTVLYIQLVEDKREKRKEGPYDSSWRDQQDADTGLFAKISRAGEELYHDDANELASAERAGLFESREATERAECAETGSLQERFEKLREQSAAGLRRQGGQGGF
jgi:hypothetical protein